MSTHHRSESNQLSNRKCTKATCEDGDNAYWYETAAQQALLRYRKLFLAGDWLFRCRSSLGWSNRGRQSFLTWYFVLCAMLQVRARGNAERSGSYPRYRIPHNWSVSVSRATHLNLPCLDEVAFAHLTHHLHAFAQSETSSLDSTGEAGDFSVGGKR